MGDPRREIGSDVFHEMKDHGLMYERPALTTTLQEVILQNHGKIGDKRGGRKHKALSNNRLEDSMATEHEETAAARRKQSVIAEGDVAQLASLQMTTNELLGSNNDLQRVIANRLLTVEVQLKEMGSIKREALRVGATALATTAVIGASWGVYKWLFAPATNSAAK